MPKKIDFLGLPFDNVTLDEAIDSIEGFIHEGTPRKIFTPNVALLVWARKDEFLKKVYQSCDLLTVDGMAIYYASHILGKPLKETASASLMFFRLIELAEQKGYTLYFLGAKDEVINLAVKRVREQYPNVKILGSHHGYFDVETDTAVADDIRAKKPDMLFIGMSSPLKEKFVERNLKTMNVPVSLGVGGMIDIAAGRSDFAPDWIRKLCLEWFYRLMQEPRRLWRRYLTTNLIFIGLVLRELVRRDFAAR